MIYRIFLVLVLSFCLSSQSFAFTVLDDLREQYELIASSSHKNRAMSVLHGVLIPVEVLTPIIGWLVAGFSHPGSRCLHRAKTASYCSDSKSRLSRAISFLEDVEKAYQRFQDGERPLKQGKYSSKFLKNISEISTGVQTFEELIVTTHDANQSGMQGLVATHPLVLSQETYHFSLSDSDTSTYPYYAAPNYLKLIKAYIVDQLRAQPQIYGKGF